MWFDNLIRLDTNFDKILKNTPWLRENVFGKALEVIEPPTSVTDDLLKWVKESVSEKTSWVTVVEFPAPKWASKWSLSLKFDKEGNPIIQVIGAPIKDGEIMKWQRTYEKAIAWMQSKWFKSFTTTTNTKSWKIALEWMVSKWLVEEVEWVYKIIKKERTPESQVISSEIRDFFDITENVTEDKKAFNRWFGTDPDSSRFLNISYDAVNETTSAESKFIDSFYKRNSAAIWQVGWVAWVDEAIRILDNQEVKTIILQDSRQISLFPKKYHNQLITPQWYTQYNYFTKDWVLYIGAKNKKLLTKIKDKVGSIRWDMLAAVTDDSVILKNLENLAKLEWMEPKALEELLLEYWKWDISRWYDIISKYKRDWFWRSVRNIDFWDKALELTNTKNTELQAIAEDILDKNGIMSTIKVTSKNREEVIEWIMARRYPEDLPSARWIISAAWLDLVPTANKAILSWKLYEMFTNMDEYFTSKIIDDIVNKYVNEWVIDLWSLEFATDELKQSVDNLFKSIKTAEYKKPKMDGLWISRVEVEDIFANEVELSAQALSETKEWQLIAQSMWYGIDKTTLATYKVSVVKEYTKLWDKYQAELTKSFGLPVSRQNEIRESFVMAMEQFDNNIINSDLGRFINVRGVTWNKYGVYKMTNEWDLRAFENLKNDAITKFKNKLDSASEVINKVDTTKNINVPAESIDEKLKNAIDKLPQSRQIDDFLSQNNIDGLDLDAKIKLYDVIKNTTDVYNYYTNDLVRYYEMTNRGMIDFFNDYQLVDTIIWSKLPRKLAEEIRIPTRDWLDTAVLDMTTKENILTKLSNEFGVNQIEKSDLESIVESAIRETNGSLEDVALYVEDFEPYLNLSRVPQDIKQLIDTKKWMIKPVLTDNQLDDIRDIIVKTQDWEKTIGELITMTPEEKMPTVMYGNNKVQKEEIRQVYDTDLFNDIQRNVEAVEVNYGADVDQTILAVRATFMQRMEDQIRWFWSKKLNTILDIDSDLELVAIDAQAWIDMILGTKTVWGSIRRIAREWASSLTKSADFGRVNNVLDTLMWMTDSQFDNAIKNPRNIDQESAVALAKYFRELQTRLRWVFTDPDMLKVIDNIHTRAFTRTRWGEEWLVRLKEQAWENLLFWLLNIDNSVIPWVDVKYGFYNLDLLGTEWARRFNEIFETNLTIKEIKQVYHAFAHTPGSGIGKLFGNGINLALNRFWFNRVWRVLQSAAALTRYATWRIWWTASMILPQSWAYLVKDQVAKKWMWLWAEENARLINWMVDNNLHETIWWAIDTKRFRQVNSLVNWMKRNDIPVGDMFTRKRSPAEIDMAVATMSSIWWGAGNINDMVFALSIYAKHIQWAIKTLDDIGYHFTSIDDFIDSQKYMSQDQINTVIGQIKARSQRTYKWEAGNSMRRQDRLVSWVRNDLIQFYSTMLSKVGWWNNVLSGTYKNLFKSFNVIKHLVTGTWSLPQRIDTIVQAVSRDFWFQNFLLNQVWSAYYAVKLGRVYDMNTNSEDEDDPYDMAMQMWQYLNFEYQWWQTSSVWRLLTGLPLGKTEEMELVGIWYPAALLATLSKNIAQGIWMKYNALKFIPQFVEWYQKWWIQEWLNQAVNFLMDMSEANMRYMYGQAVSDGWVQLNSSEIWQRAQVLLGNELKSRKDQDKTSNIRLYSELLALTTDYAKTDEAFERYYFDQQTWEEKTRLQRTWQLLWHLFGKWSFWSVLDWSNQSTSKWLAKVLTENPLMRQYGKNWFIDLATLDPESRREYTKLLAQDLFGNQRLWWYSDGESITSAWFYTTLENYTLGDKTAIKNKATLKMLDWIPENDIKWMMDELGEANTTNKRKALEINFMNRYKDKPELALFTVMALAEKEYLDTKWAVNDYYKQLNKWEGTENDVKITFKQDQDLRDSIIEKYSKPLQLADREYSTWLLYSAIIASESRKTDSKLQWLVKQKKDDNGEIVYDIYDSNFVRTAWELIDIERAWSNWIVNAWWATNSPLAQTMKYVKDDVKVAFIKYWYDQISTNMNLTENQKIEQKVWLLNADPSLIQKKDEIKNLAGPEVWDTYVSMWYGLYKDTDDVLNIYNEAMTQDGLIWAQWTWWWTVSQWRIIQAEPVNVKLPGIDISKLRSTVQSNKFNSQWRKLAVLDDKFKFSASSLLKSSNQPSWYKLNPLWDLSASSNVYFKETWWKTQSETKRTKFTKPKKKLLKKGK